MDHSSKTVLFVSHESSRSGAPIFLLRFLRWFREHHAAPFRILAGEWGPLVNDFETVAPVDLFEPKPTLRQKVMRRLGRPIRRDNSRHLALLRQKLSESDIGLIYSNTTANGHILDFLSFLNCPVISHVHELDFAIGSFGLENFDLVKQHTSSYVAVSHAVKRNLVENRGIPEDKVRMIHGFIPIESKESEAGDFAIDVRRELGVPAGAKLVCACGTIESRKGVDIYLQVARRVKEMRRTAPIHFLWVGGWPREVRAMRKEARALGVGDIVYFIGRRSDVNPYYKASDIFLLPSREDPFPLVMLEAAWRRKPTVCFDNTGGAPEFIEQDAGFAVQKLDVVEMAKKVVELLDSDDLRERMGETARNKVATRHDLRVGAPKIAEVIEDAFLPRTHQYARP